jgi:2,3-dihydroxybenzoate decarboxylase
MKKVNRPSKEDYKYYFTHNVNVTTSGDFSTKGLKFCIEELGFDRCLYSIGKNPTIEVSFDSTPVSTNCFLDTPYDTIKDGQDWWKSIDLPEKEKEAIARGNAIRLFKLPLDL